MHQVLSLGILVRTPGKTTGQRRFEAVRIIRILRVGNRCSRTVVLSKIDLTAGPDVGVALGVDDGCRALDIDIGPCCQRVIRYGGKRIRLRDNLRDRPRSS